MIKILAGGKKHQAWVREACEEYEKRLRKPFNIVWEFVDEDKLTEKVRSLSPYKCFTILLDERGKDYSSLDLARTLTTRLVFGDDVVIIIGGAFGHFDDELKKNVNLVMSLSKMVFPHQICRVIMTEQIYRTQEIYLEHPYHHA